MSAGEATPGLVEVLAGRVAVTERNLLDVQQPIVTYGDGDFMGEVAQLGGRPVLAKAVWCANTP